MDEAMRIGVLEEKIVQFGYRLDAQCRSYLEALESMTVRVASLEERISGERGLWYRATKIESELEHLKRLPEMVQRLSDMAQQNAIMLQSLAEHRARSMTGFQQLGVTVISGILIAIILHLLIPKHAPFSEELRMLKQQQQQQVPSQNGAGGQ